MSGQKGAFVNLWLTMELWSYSNEGIVSTEYFHESNFLSISGGSFGVLDVIFENQIGLGFHLLIIEAEKGTESLTYITLLYINFPVREAVKGTHIDMSKLKLVQYLHHVVQIVYIRQMLYLRLKSLCSLHKHTQNITMEIFWKEQRKWVFRNWNTVTENEIVKKLLFSLVNKTNV